MASRKLPHAEDIFKSQNRGGEAVSNSSKSKKALAPAPPSGVLPKIGNYTPKFLMTPTLGTDIQEKLDFKENEGTGVLSNKGEAQPLIIGDKDVPLDINHTDSTPVPPPRRKRKAPSIPGNGVESFRESVNPLFGRSNIADDESMDDTEEQGAVIDFGFGSNYNEMSNDHDNVSITETIEPDYKKSITADDEPIQSDLPYIPPPDYDDEEMTFSFYEEGKQVFKEYAGEDFGKYLDEDDDYRLQQIRRGVRRPPSHMNGGQRQPRNPQIPGKTFKKKKKGTIEAEKRNTLRDFTFSDTKIGFGDRTVKSTSAKGRYMKRERNKINPKAHFRTPKSKGPSYEDFLLGKQRPESQNNSNSLEYTEDTSMHGNVASTDKSKEDSNNDEIYDRMLSQMYHHSRPKQLHSNIDNHDHKSSLWKRLTWKFKKSVNISKMSGR